jgi:hypothetical protein
MHMGVPDGLSGCGAYIDAQVVAVRHGIRARPLANKVHNRPDGALLLRRQFEVVGDVTPRDDEDVAGGHGKGVVERQSELILNDDALRVHRAERAEQGLLGHSLTHLL